METEAALPPRLSPTPTLTDYVLAAARELIRSVEHTHDTKEPPHRYAVPYGAVNTLRAAVSAYEADPPLSGPRATLSGQMLKEALELVAPDGDADQLESEVFIQWGDGHSGPGYYCSLAEYPDEGAILLGPEPSSGGESQ